VPAAPELGKESALCLIPNRDGNLANVDERDPLLDRLPQLDRVLPLLDRVLPQLARAAVGGRGSPVRRAICSSFCCAKYSSLQ